MLEKRREAARERGCLCMSWLKEREFQPSIPSELKGNRRFVLNNAGSVSLDSRWKDFNIQISRLKDVYSSFASDSRLNMRRECKKRIFSVEDGDGRTIHVLLLLLLFVVVFPGRGKII